MKKYLPLLFFLMTACNDVSYEPRSENLELGISASSLAEPAISLVSPYLINGALNLMEDASDYLLKKLQQAGEDMIEAQQSLFISEQAEQVAYLTCYKVFLEEVKASPGVKPDLKDKVNNIIPLVERQIRSTHNLISLAKDQGDINSFREAKEEFKDLDHEVEPLIRVLLEDINKENIFSSARKKLDENIQRAPMYVAQKPLVEKSLLISEKYKDFLVSIMTISDEKLTNSPLSHNSREELNLLVGAITDAIPLFDQLRDNYLSLSYLLSLASYDEFDQKNLENEKLYGSATSRLLSIYEDANQIDYVHFNKTIFSQALNEVKK